MKSFSYSLVALFATMALINVNAAPAASVPNSMNKKLLPAPLKCTPPQPIPSHPPVPTCPGPDRTCIWYHDNCFSNKDCPAGQVCCNFPRCGNTCVDLWNPLA
ncbi:MAG: hypothetical protein J3R72DRAFT_444531 [Linnemannia gamsii]|nr:MAG: hypothetical protein J3R72DRAFT_444531 [Linnemannia gamsii]